MLLQEQIDQLVQKAKENLLETYKGLQMVGTQNGYGAPENLVEIINEEIEDCWDDEVAARIKQAIAQV